MLCKLVPVFFDCINLEHIALFEVVESFKTDTAFVAFANFLDSVLESLERCNCVICNNDAVTDNSYACLLYTSDAADE